MLTEVRFKSSDPTPAGGGAARAPLACRPGASRASFVRLSRATWTAAWSLSQHIRTSRIGTMGRHGVERHTLSSRSRGAFGVCARRIQADATHALHAALCNDAGEDMVRLLAAWSGELAPNEGGRGRTGRRQGGGRARAERGQREGSEGGRTTG